LAGRDPECIFCQIITDEAEASFVYRDEVVTAFMDLFPVNAGHLLVVPNEHTMLIDGIEEDTLREMFSVSRMLAGGLRRSGLRCEGVNLLLADGRSAGQVILHSHLHVIPRFHGDECGLRLHAGPIKESSRAELEAVASRLRNVLSQP
jgi:histidine triad (HIT) family protein